MAQDERPILFFDGVCNLCQRSVQLVLKHDVSRSICVASLQSEAARVHLSKHFSPEDALPESLVFIEQGKAYYYADAVLRVVRYMRWHYQIMQVGWLMPRAWRNGIYRWVGRNRYRWFGRRESCWLPRPEWEERFLA